MTFCNNLLAAVYTCRTLKTFDTLRNEKHYKGSPEASKAAEILYQAKMENISASFAKGLNAVAKRYTDNTLISMPQSDIYSNTAGFNSDIVYVL